MKTRIVEKSKMCQCCRQETFKQVYDFKSGVWIYYCFGCQEPTDDDYELDDDYKILEP
jgi:hypothetical protein